MLRPPPRPTLFPYTTLFRSARRAATTSSRSAWRCTATATPTTADSRPARGRNRRAWADRKSTRLNSSHGYISYAVFCLKKKKRVGTKEEEKTEQHSRKLTVG